jgi:two-component system, chemotaxis family, protein-glutamate methylesterase/glutaminase
VEKDTVSVLIVDDSALMRNLIGKIIESAEGLEVAGKAMNGRFALQKIDTLQPDVIVLDLEMPEMNGIDFLRARRERGITIPVVILSSLAKKGAKITMEALNLGASDFIMKPSGSVSGDIHTVGRHIIDALRAYGLNYKKQRGVIITQEDPRQHAPALEKPAVPGDTVSAPRAERRTEAPLVPLTAPPKKAAGAIELVVIGISTGGPNALREVFAHIEADLPAPVVVVQHMPAGFTEEFAKSLDRVSPLSITEAKDGDVLQPGRVLIAPGNFHIEVEKRRLAPVVTLSSADLVNGHRPSADVLFASAVKQYKNNILAVIMTGMGKDGAREIGSIRAAGGITIGQNRETCVVYGMPKVAIENGYIQHVVPLNEIGPLISRLAKENN